MGDPKILCRITNKKIVIPSKCKPLPSGVYGCPQKHICEHAQKGKCGGTIRK